MKIIYTDNHKQHNPPYEIYDGIKEPYAEKADRLVSIVERLEKEGIPYEGPNSYPLSFIKKIHQDEYISFLTQRSKRLNTEEILYPSYHIMDTYTPISSGTYEAALSSVNVAVTGAEAVLKGESVVYSLCRPPGHHADYKTMGGYCYFNNAAIAAEYLSSFGRVAILDVDFHHGNGTQSIFYERSDVLYVSLHADPIEKFPYTSGFQREKGSGEGYGYTVNYPLPLGTTNIRYRKTLRRALRDIRKFKADYLIVSLGFDTYEKDPIGGFRLTEQFYHTMAQEIMSLNLPTLLIQEGGYNVEDLGKLAISFLKGISAVRNEV